MNTITSTNEIGLNKLKVAYYVFTGLLTAIMMLSAGMYLFNHGEVQKAFIALGYPTYIIYPLAVAKILGLVAVWSRKSEVLTQLAYAGFFYNFILAFFAHVAVNDGEWFGAMMALIFLGGSYLSRKKLYR